MTLPLDFLAFFGFGALCVLGGLGWIIYDMHREVVRLKRIASGAILGNIRITSVYVQPTTANALVTQTVWYELPAEREGLTPRAATTRAMLH